VYESAREGTGPRLTSENALGAFASMKLEGGMSRFSDDFIERNVTIYTMK
jgi:hypothetical protein